MRRWIAVVALSLTTTAAVAGSTPSIDWQAWSAQAFAAARAQDRPVFLYLEAVWCHWCHVMQQNTFTDQRVIARLREDFVALRVDHDANPGLANRYRDYGWPALIFLTPDGQDLVKRAGYLAPEAFAALLDAIASDPTPESAAPVTPSPPVAAGALGPDARAYLLRRHDESFDPELGGLRTAQKFLDRDSVEYALQHADEAAERRKARLTLDAARALIDPVWGGAYQYSTGRVWSNPHYEKIMRVQAGYLRIYSLAYGRLGDPADRDTAADLRRYLFDFLRAPDGAFYVSQDADVVPGQKSPAFWKQDDAGRRAIGMPRIDRNRYADANAMAAEALAVHHAFTGDPDSLLAAERALDWTLRERRGDSGLLRHGDEPDAAPHLSDTLHAARAALQLYEVGAQRRWLHAAVVLGDAFDARLRDPAGGYLTAAALPGVPLQPVPDVVENILAARFFVRLHHYGGEDRHREAARHAMRFLAAHAARREDFEEAGILLADEELARDPLHLTVVGAREDPQAAALFAVARATPGSYRRIEWWDRAEGPLPNADVAYPDFDRAAAYVCTEGRCSRPSYSGPEYTEQIRRLTGAAVDSP